MKGNADALLSEFVDYNHSITSFTYTIKADSIAPDWSAILKPMNGKPARIVETEIGVIWVVHQQ